VQPASKLNSLINGAALGKKVTHENWVPSGIFN